MDGADGPGRPLSAEGGIPTVKPSKYTALDDDWKIAKVFDSEWRLLDGTGPARCLKSHEPYHLRVEFTGDRFTLFHNDAPVLRAIDNDYFSGFCGLRTNKTEARFQNVDIQKVKPKCFIIMPFDVRRHHRRREPAATPWL
jgi:hypothetical protein